MTVRGASSPGAGAAKAANGRPTVGLAGCGLWGRNILRDLLALDCTVVVADVDPARRREALEAGAAAVVAAPDSLPDVEGIVVATPATAHGAVVEGLLGRSVPIFCEKPLTTDVGSARRLADLGGGRLFVMHVWRYHPGVACLAALARSGELGPLLALHTERKNWTSPRTDTDAIWTLVPHDLSIAIAILGAIPPPRSAAVEMIDGRPVAMMALLGDAPFLSIDCSTRYAEKRRAIRLHCRDGVAVLPDGESGHIEILRAGRGGKLEVERRACAGEAPLMRELRLFVAHLRGGPPPPTDAAEGAAVVAAVAALRDLAGVA